MFIKGGGHLVKGSKYLMFSLFEKKRIVMPARNEQTPPVPPQIPFKEGNPKGHIGFIIQTVEFREVSIIVCIPRCPYAS